MPEALLVASNYEVIGRADAPVVVALGGISASRCVAAWWGGVAADGGYVDTERFQVLGLDYLDGGAAPDGRPERAVSTHDQADALARALDDLEIGRAHAVVGASYGGMVALAFAERYPARADRLIVIGGPARAHPMSTALRVIQRRIVELGLETGRAFDALALARALAMTTYRSAKEFGERFDRGSLTTFGMTDVESYLMHHGEKFAARFSPSRFLALSLSADLHRVAPEGIRMPALLVAAEGDTIVPREQMAELAARWGGPARLVELPSRVGHDAFLAEPHDIGPVLRNALTSSRFP